MFELRFNIKPVGWKQPGRDRQGRRFTPVDLRAFKAEVKLAWNAKYQDAVPLEGAVHLVAEFRRPRTKGQIWKTKPMPRLWDTKAPDLTNLVKALEDALSGLAFRDDRQVVRHSTYKVVCAGDEQPGFIVKIIPIDEGAHR